MVPSKMVFHLAINKSLMLVFTLRDAYVREFQLVTSLHINVQNAVTLPASVIVSMLEPT